MADEDFANGEDNNAHDNNILPGENKLNWDRKEILRVIRLYEAHPQLWDTSSKGYRDRGERAEAWKEIARRMGTSEAEVQRKMKNLRTQFCDHTKKAQNEEVYKPKWEFYEMLLFIKNQDNPRLTAYNCLEIVDDTSMNSDEKSMGITSTPAAPKRQPAKKQKVDGDQQTLLNNSYQIMALDPGGIDEFSVFGNFVASEIRQLKLEKSQAKLRLLIQKCVIQVAEEDQEASEGLEKASSTRRVRDRW